MSLPQLKPYLTPKEYLTLERQATYRSEYFEGEIFAMAGASDLHNTISGNVFAELHLQLKKRPCKVYMNDMRVKIYSTGLYTYPDVMIVCGTLRFDDAQKDTLLNPTVIIEVLSPSTATYDRGKKFEHYRTLDSLKEYLLIAQDECHLEHYVRQPHNQWLKLELNQLQDTVELSSIQCHLALVDVYDKTRIFREK
jgi:Uma2 family endonuclease